METNRKPAHLRHPISRKTYRIPYVRTFAFLALIVIVLALAAIGRAAPHRFNGGLPLTVASAVS